MLFFCVIFRLICVCKLLSTRSDFLLSVKAAYENRRFLATEARLKISDIYPSRVPTFRKLQLIKSFWGFFTVRLRLFDRTSDCKCSAGLMLAGESAER